MAFVGIDMGAISLCPNNALKKERADHWGPLISCQCRFCDGLSAEKRSGSRNAGAAGKLRGGNPGGHESRLRGPNARCIDQIETARDDFLTGGPSAGFL